MNDKKIRKQLDFVMRLKSLWLKQTDYDKAQYYEKKLYRETKVLSNLILNKEDNNE